ncbi:LSU ribosomal protein L2p [Fibrobacteria bacterium R8-3-H12]
MGLKSYKPTTPTLRYKQISAKEEVTTEKPYKPLTVGIKRSSGRDNQGHISSRRRGGGHKKRYRIIDFKRKEFIGIPCKVETIEYDPKQPTTSQAYRSLASPSPTPANRRAY